jgi:hypothetical protein
MTFSRRKTMIAPNHYLPFNGPLAVGYGSGNANQLFFSPSNTFLPQKQGGWIPMAPTYDLYRMYSDNDTVRRKATIMLTGDLYPELDQAHGGYKATMVGLEKTHYWQRKR